MKLAFDPNGFLPLALDPKTSIASENIDALPVDVDTGTREQLLRVPGVGPTSVGRILSNRKRHSVDNWRDLQAMGVVRKRAWPFVAFPGQRPPRAKQLKLELFRDNVLLKHPDAAPNVAASSTTPAAGGHGMAPCGQATSCTGCPMYGMPGHPGSPCAVWQGLGAAN